jgi:hypothetical protein
LKGKNIAEKLSRGGMFLTHLGRREGQSVAHASTTASYPHKGPALSFSLESHVCTCTPYCNLLRTSRGSKYTRQTAAIVFQDQSTEYIRGGFIHLHAPLHIPSVTWPCLPSPGAGPEEARRTKNGRNNPFSPCYRRRQETRPRTGGLWHSMAF